MSDASCGQNKRLFLQTRHVLAERVDVFIVNRHPPGRGVVEREVMERADETEEPEPSCVRRPYEWTSGWSPLIGLLHT
jgi:hypothetical protein